MKKIAFFLVLSFVLMFAISAFAQTSSPSPVAAVTATPAVTPAATTGFVAFVKANLAAIALAVYGILDVVVLVSPGLAGNGIVHQLILLTAKLAGQNPPAA
jgi:hypothetical protein